MLPVSQVYQHDKLNEEALKNLNEAASGQAKSSSLPAINQHVEPVLVVLLIFERAGSRHDFAADFARRPINHIHLMY